MKEQSPQNSDNKTDFYDIDDQIKQSDSEESKVSNDQAENSKSSQVHEEGEQKKQIQQLQDELEKQKKNSQKNKDRYLRALADYENLEKRTRTEKSRIFKNANANLLSKMLEIADTLEKAKSSFLDTSNNDEIKEGFQAIEKQFFNLLHNEGVEKLESVGEKFDPTFHEAIFVKTDSGEEEDIILEEVQAGYTLNSTLLRPSKVIIAK
ncbi:MAG: nucleotide exchange factor GrpE [Candidatus Hodarchaeales archaeon]|jgi:molecular chaperone GrpE